MAAKVIVWATTAQPGTLHTSRPCAAQVRGFIGPTAVDATVAISHACGRCAHIPPVPATVASVTAAASSHAQAVGAETRLTLAQVVDHAVSTRNQLCREAGIPLPFP